MWVERVFEVPLTSPALSKGLAGCATPPSLGGTFGKSSKVGFKSLASFERLIGRTTPPSLRRAFGKSSKFGFESVAIFKELIG